MTKPLTPSRLAVPCYSCRQLVSSSPSVSSQNLHNACHSPATPFCPFRASQMSNGTQARTCVPSAFELERGGGFGHYLHRFGSITELHFPVLAHPTNGLDGSLSTSCMVRYLSHGAPRNMRRILREPRAWPPRRGPRIRKMHPIARRYDLVVISRHPQAAGAVRRAPRPHPHPRMDPRR